MREYHKIQTVYKRDPANNYRTLLIGEYSVPEFEYLKGNKWVFTEKVDGTNIRVMFDGSSVAFGGKTDRAQIPAKLVTALRETFDHQLGTMGGMFEDGACLYGEGYGAKIQKGGGNYRQDQGFVLFDVKVGDWWLGRDDIVDIAMKLSLDVVPIIGTGVLADMEDRCRSGFASTWGDFTAEGIVARPDVELKARNGSRIITKLKHKDFAQEATK